MRKYYVDCAGVVVEACDDVVSVAPVDADDDTGPGVVVLAVVAAAPATTAAEEGGGDGARARMIAKLTVAIATLVRLPAT
jgi:hypothetical protein